MQSKREALRASLTLQETRSIHDSMNIPKIEFEKTSSLLQSKREALRASLTLQETRSIHDSMNIPKIRFIAYIDILL